MYNKEHLKPFEVNMRIGIIGGGNHWKQWQQPFTEINQETPYGAMADVICAGHYNNHEIFTLQRHGGNYQLLHQDIPWKANVYGMFLQQLDFIVHLTACGSLRESDTVGDLILFDQIIDFTKHRPSSLGYPAIEQVSYLDFSKPISEELINFAHSVLISHNISHGVSGVMLTEEGPKFSSLAESIMFKHWGADFLNMTSSPEVYFCRELSIPVLAIAMVTNKIQLNDGSISSDEITSNISSFKTRIPTALSLLFEAMPEKFSLKKIQTMPYDSNNFDLRGEP
jgi:5'-methylthioadenosine phosphorylase